MTGGSGGKWQVKSVRQQTGRQLQQRVKWKCDLKNDNKTGKCDKLDGETAEQNMLHNSCNNKKSGMQKREEDEGKKKNAVILFSLATYLQSSYRCCQWFPDPCSDGANPAGPCRCGNPSARPHWRPSNWFCLRVERQQESEGSSEVSWVVYLNLCCSVLAI